MYLAVRNSDKAILFAFHLPTMRVEHPDKLSFDLLTQVETPDPNNPWTIVLAGARTHRIVTYPHAPTIPGHITGTALNRRHDGSYNFAYDNLAPAYFLAPPLKPRGTGG